MIDTKHKILDTAERLIGEHGYASTSLRQIIAEAEVNLAAIHYHFGSKEELLDELIVRKVGPVNVTRLMLLDRLEADAGRVPPTVRSVLDAFFVPMAEMGSHEPLFVRMMGRVLAEGLMNHIAERHFQEVSRRFLDVLRKALPWLSEDEVLWRTHFMIGAMAHTMSGQPDNTGKGGVPVSLRTRIEHLIAFLAGGFEAPASTPSQREETR